MEKSLLSLCWTRKAARALINFLCPILPGTLKIICRIDTIHREASSFCENEKRNAGREYTVENRSVCSSEHYSLEYFPTLYSTVSTLNKDYRHLAELKTVEVGLTQDIRIALEAIFHGEGSCKHLSSASRGHPILS